MMESHALEVMSDEDPLPRRKGGPVKRYEHQSVLNLIQDCLKEPDIDSVTLAIKRASEITGISVRTIYRIRERDRKERGEAPPTGGGPKRPPRPIDPNSPSPAAAQRKKFDDFYSNILVQKYQELCQDEQEPPSVNRLIQEMNNVGAFPKVSKTTMSRLLRESGLVPGKDKTPKKSSKENITSFVFDDSQSMYSIEPEKDPLAAEEDDLLQVVDIVEMDDLGVGANVTIDGSGRSVNDVDFKVTNLSEHDYYTDVNGGGYAFGAGDSDDEEAPYPQLHYEDDDED